MTQRVRLERNTQPTKALAVRQKHKRDNEKTSDELKENMPRWVWSELPDDIVRHIIAQLCWSDRIRWRAVCKSLRSLVHGVQTRDEFPWIMSCSWQRHIDGKIYSRLADPSAQKCYMIESTVKEKERVDFVSSEPCASRNGWVLFLLLLECDPFFFYCPFTNEVIKLPKLNLNLDLDMDMDFNGEEEIIIHMKATFSSNPTSPDCVVFVLFNNETSGRCITINTWSPGDKTWTQTYSGLPIALDVTSSGGIFYCVFVDGRLGAYNAVLKEWKLFPNVLPVNLEGATAYLIDSKQDKDPLLMLAFEGYWQLWRFDLSQEYWVEEQTIGNRAIFLGCTSYSVPVVGRSSEFANKIYCLEVIDHNTVPRCASLESPALTSQTGFFDRMPKIPVKNSIWIQPPLK